MAGKACFDSPLCAGTITGGYLQYVGAHLFGVEGQTANTLAVPSVFSLLSTATGASVGINCRPHGRWIWIFVGYV